MGFSIFTFPEIGKPTPYDEIRDVNGCFNLKANETRTLHIDLQTSNTILGDLSLQGLCSESLNVEIYYSNWDEKLPDEFGFGDTDYLNIDKDGLWFKYTPDLAFVANTPKHFPITLPVCRYMLVRIKNTTANVAKCVFHILAV